MAALGFIRDVSNPVSSWEKKGSGVLVATRPQILTSESRLGRFPLHEEHFRLLRSVDDADS